MFSWLNESLIVQALPCFSSPCTTLISWTHCSPSLSCWPYPAIYLVHGASFCISRVFQSLLFLCSTASELFIDHRWNFKFLSLVSKAAWSDSNLHCQMYLPLSYYLSPEGHSSQYLKFLSCFLTHIFGHSDFLPRMLSHIPFAIPHHCNYFFFFFG